MAKFEATTARLFRRIFVCKKCKTKIRTDISRVLQKKVKCRSCQSKAFRPINTKK
ncbi:hypothetical protein HOD38_03595 [archaeon]|nr:hypothetical protein [archaeon]MBT4397324.1 hypothetical protein [archaeon]MBT4440704.1 hypothetical protein [archaeon]